MRAVRFIAGTAGLAAAMSGMSAAGQQAGALGPGVRRYVQVASPRVVLTHARVIDGTGTAAVVDRNIVIEHGRIAAILPGADERSSDSTTVIDLHGDAVLPGIVGMHDHMIYMSRPNRTNTGASEGPALFRDMPYSAPRLYLANGVTTARTTGSANPYADVAVKRAIEVGEEPGPHLDVTGPYLDGPGGSVLEMPTLKGAEDARQTVAFWANRGVTSFKAYAHITRDALRAAIEEAHRRGLKITGHLCSVTYPEAVEAGIDNLEHGFLANTEMDPDKKPDVCSDSGGTYTLDHMLPDSPEAKRLFALLVAHGVAVTSTLALRATNVVGIDSATSGLRPRLVPEALDAMSPAARQDYILDRNLPMSAASVATAAARLRREMDMERAFVAAGGLLLSGPDPVGFNGLVPGFSDHTQMELLVAAGFTPLEAIRISTLNGATYLGRQDRIGSIAVGKNADLLVVRGDPSVRIADIENVVIVFKDGVGYDREKLLAAVRGRYGEY